MKTKLLTILSKWRRRFQTQIENAIAFCINKYKVNPYGYCPVQAEGYLPTGEYYYFRSRHETWSVRIAKCESTIWDKDAWIYFEEKYEPYAGGWISKLEVVRNFNKAIKLYYKEKTK